MTFRKKACKCALLLAAAMLLLVACGKSTAKRWQEQYDLGQRYVTELNYGQAILAFQAAIEIDPATPESYIGLARVYETLGDTEKALQVLNDGYAVTSDDAIADAMEAMKEAQPPAGGSEAGTGEAADQQAEGSSGPQKPAEPPKEAIDALAALGGENKVLPDGEHYFAYIDKEMLFEGNEGIYACAEVCSEVLLSDEEIQALKIGDTVCGETIEKLEYRKLYPEAENVDILDIGNSYYYFEKRADGWILLEADDLPVAADSTPAIILFSDDSVIYDNFHYFHADTVQKVDSVGDIFESVQGDWQQPYAPDLCLAALSLQQNEVKEATFLYTP